VINELQIHSFHFEVGNDVISHVAQKIMIENDKIRSCRYFFYSITFLFVNLNISH